MTTLPRSLYFKSMLVASPFEGFAKRLQNLVSLRWRSGHPELAELFLEDERAEIALRRLLKRDSNCVDVGCHIGSFLSLILRICPSGEHIAIEASPQKSAWLKTKFPAVDIRSVAVGRDNGTATFFEDPKRPGFSRLHDVTSDTAASYEVQVRTLDDILADKPRIDLIKIDIEGGELNAFRGAVKTIVKHRPILYFECGSDHDLNHISVSRKDIFDLLTGPLGYQIFTLPDFLYDKGPLSFDEFRKCGIYPFRAFNFVALPNDQH